MREGCSVFCVVVSWMSVKKGEKGGRSLSFGIGSRKGTCACAFAMDVEVSGNGLI